MGKIEQAMIDLRRSRSRPLSTREIADELDWPMAKTRRELKKLVEQGHVSELVSQWQRVSLWRLEADTPKGEI